MRLPTALHFLYASSSWVASSLDNTAFAPSSSDSQTSCTDDFDNTALMQTRLALTRDRDLESNHKHHHAKIERAKHMGDAGIMETTVRSMSTTIDDLEHKIHDDPSGSWDEQAATLSSFRATIVDQLQVFLDSEHAQDQTEFNNRKQQHTGCGGGQRWEAGGDVANAAAELARWRAKHQACRSSERAWLTYKTTGISSSSCASDSDISTQHQVFAAHVTLAALVGAAQSRADAYDLTDPPGSRDCPLDQTQFEDHFCTWRSAHYYACAASQDCTAQTGLSGLRDELLIRSDNRRNLWRTLEMLLCRVGHLLGSMDGDSSTEVSDFNTTDNCSNILVDQTKFVLDLTIPVIPVCNDHIAVSSSTSILVAPSMVDSVMCQQFREANYGLDYGWDQGQHVIPSECEATCPAISYSTWVVPSACSNEADDCRFYNHHRDACGSYDTATFVAGDACCACGGGALATAPAVVFDQANAALTVSSGSVSGNGNFGWRTPANAARQISANDGICGISFKCNTAESHLMVGLASVEVTNWPDIDFGVTCRGAQGNFLDIFERSSHIKRLYDRPGNGNPTTDVHAIRVNQNGEVEYSVGGSVYYTSSRAVIYPWHVGLDVHTSPSLSELQYLDC